MDDKEKEGSVEMNMIRFIQHCSRDCSVKLIAHGAVGKKSYSFLKSYSFKAKGKGGLGCGMNLKRI